MLRWRAGVGVLCCAWSAGAQVPPSAVLPGDDLPAFRAEAERVEGLLHSAADRAAVTYELARTWAAAKQWPETVGWLRMAVGMRAGLDPSRDSIFAELRSTREFDDILATVRSATPPVSHSSSAFVATPGDLVPESMAYDPKGRQFYFGSMRKGLVTRCSERGECAPFASGLGVILGLKAHGESLWVLNNSPGESSLIEFNLASGPTLPQVRRKYAVTGSGHAFNDLTVAANGDIYLTDTPAGAVWQLKNGTARLTQLADHFQRANGIALSPDGKLLYVSTFPDGIAMVELKTNAASPMVRPAGLCLAFIDGLYAYRDSLIAIQNGYMNPRVVRLRLDSAGRKIRSFEVLERRNPLFDGVTTGVIVDSEFFYMANIQDEKKSGFNPIAVLKLHL